MKSIFNLIEINTISKISLAILLEVRVWLLYCVKSTIEVRWWKRKFALFWGLAKGRNLEGELLSKG